MFKKLLQTLSGKFSNVTVNCIRAIGKRKLDRRCDSGGQGSVYSHFKTFIIHKLQRVILKNLSTVDNNEHKTQAYVLSTWVTSPFNVCVSRSPLALSLFEHLQVHAERLLNGVLGDEADKVLDVHLSVGQ